MPTHTFFPRLPAAALLAAAAVLLGACSSVDLNQQRYNPPPVRQVQPIAPVQPATPAGGLPVAQPSPITAAQPVGQPLPPVGTPQPGALPVQAPSAGAPITSDTAQGHLVTLTTQLSGLSAVPATRSAGGGQLDVLYDANTRLLRWKTRWHGLAPITAVQFHGPALEGQIAPATLIWPAPFGPTYEGRATLTAEQGEDLMQGRWYVNVQTRDYPAGEVRGQLRVVR